MLKIATHNSATGEKGKGLLSWLVTPFARCQSKTIREQLEAGVTYFDLRVRFGRNGNLYLAHGLWLCKTSCEKTIWILSDHSLFNGCDVYASITYEGDPKDEYARFFSWCEWIMKTTNIKLTTVNVKKPRWRAIKTYNHIPYKQAYKKLDGSSWHTYLPLPWLWKKLYHNKPTFNEETYKMVDFL